MSADPQAWSRRKGRPLIRRLVLMLALALAGATLQPTAASAAISGAQFPTLGYGQDGIDVLALQYIISGHGGSVTVSGTFDQATADYLSAWQSFSGQAVTGTAYPSMMTSPFVPTLSSSSTNAQHIRALQTLLQKVYGGYSVVNGSWSATVTVQVQGFQTHIGESATGVVDITTWRHLFWHYRQVPDDSANVCWKAWPSQGQYENGSEQWGTGHAYENIRQSATRLTTEIPASGNGWWGALALGDIGYEHGGYHPDHGSHQVGLDADIRLIRSDLGQCDAPSNYTDPSYAFWGTYWEVYAIHQDSGPYNYYLKVIWFNDANMQYWWPKVDSSSGHDDHLHVRYCTQSPAPTSSYVC
jgi:hypothetical protein